MFCLLLTFVLSLFVCNPADFLRNSSGIDFGTKQRGEKIDDVILPPWAKGSADEFVRLNRAALESEYVSLNLHHWIDLIFGFKQLGRAAVEANNVFFHLTYEGGVDIDRIEDETVRDATIAQIEHFGQTPSQLFSAPHPTRIRQQEQAENEIPTLFQQLRQLQAMQAAGSSSSSSASSHHSEAQRLMLQLYTVEQVTATAATENPLLFLALLPGTDRLLTVALDRVMALHKFKNTIQEYIPPFLLEIDRKAAGATNSKNTSSMAVVAGATGQPAYAATMPAGGMMMPSSTGSSSGSGAGGSGGLGSALSFMSSGGKNGTASGRRVGVHFTVGLNILPFFFLVSADQRFLLSCGHWDNSFRVTAVDSGENVHSCSAHKDIVTCLAISDAGDYVVTGSKDTSQSNAAQNTELRSFKNGRDGSDTRSLFVFAFLSVSSCVRVAGRLSCDRHGFSPRLRQSSRWFCRRSCGCECGCVRGVVPAGISAARAARA